MFPKNGTLRKLSGFPLERNVLKEGRLNADETEKAAVLARIEELQERLKVIDSKDKSFLDSYIDDKFSLEEYRAAKKMIEGERKIIVAEIEKLTPKEKSKNNIEPKTREEIIQCFKENWCNYSNIEKRQFLLKHINKISVVNHAVENSIFGRCEIIDIEFNTN